MAAVTVLYPALREAGGQGPGFPKSAGEQPGGDLVALRKKIGKEAGAPTKAAPESARQGADVNSTWRRSLSGAAKHCFTSERPLRVSLAVFSGSRYSTHFRMRQQVVTEALLTATGRFLNLPPESPFRRPARCGSPFGKLPRPEADCKRLPARNPQQVVQAGRMGSAYPPSARAHPPAGRTRSRASRNTCALAPR